MLKVDDYTNLKYILILLGILIFLLIVRSFLARRIYKKDLEIAKKISIGYEEIQEDYAEVTSTPNGTLAVLADGIGKNEAGRISSIAAVNTIINMFKEEGCTEKLTYFFNKAFNKANKEVIKRVEKDKGGASVLAVVVNKNLLSYALVGDAMLAIFRNNELVRLSEGHSVSEVAKKEYYNGKIEKREALYALKENKLLYYVGQEYFQNMESPEIPIELQKNDTVLLMSRGVFESLRWVEFEEILNNKKAAADEICEEIMERIKNKNNCNGSIILMKYTGK